MARGWRGEGKRHSLAARGYKSGRKPVSTSKMSSHVSEAHLCDFLDFSKAPEETLLTIVTDPTANRGAVKKAHDELVAREHSEHPEFTVKQAHLIVRDHVKKFKREESGYKMPRKIRRSRVRHKSRRKSKSEWNEAFQSLDKGASAMSKAIGRA